MFCPIYPIYPKCDTAEELDNILLIRKHLQSCSRNEQPTKGKRTDLPYEGAGNVRDIYNWLDKKKTEGATSMR